MKYFLFTLTLFIFISCGQVSNINYNDSVVNLYDSFTQRNIELEKSVFSDTISVQKRLNALDNFENFAVISNAFQKNYKMKKNTPNP